MGRKLDLSGLTDNEAEHVLQVVHALTQVPVEAGDKLAHCPLAMAHSKSTPTRGNSMVFFR